MDNVAFPSADEQQRILNDASNAIKRSAFLMRKAIEDDNMRDALKNAAGMLAELRTSQLQPQKYYELYMLVFDQLAHLEAFFADERGKGRSYVELYELVQHAGNVLPRLYLMVAVGCLYIKSHEASPRDVLKDLVEMCKGVQHPTRGLFLRAYLCQRAKGLLPDTGSEFEGPDSGSIQDALDFLMTNFIEMNKLWVRLQHQGSARDKEKRERERQQLQDLVGKNLTYLSQLDGLSFELYRDQVLPRVLDQITSCKDDLAQLYLMQALIQGFPDRFHLGTLETLLGALPQLQPGVKVHSVMAALMDRLAKYAASAASGASDPRVLEELAAIDAFRKFKDAIARVIASQPNLPAADAVEMYTALLSYAGSVHPGALSYVDEVLAATYNTLGGRGSGLGGDARAERQLAALLTVPLAKYGVSASLDLREYPPLTRLLRYVTHKELAVKIVHKVLDSGSPAAAKAAPGSSTGASGITLISSVEKVGSLFRFIAPLVADPDVPGEPGGATELDDEDLDEEQVLVARLLHHLRSHDPDTHFAILKTAHQQLLEGGPRRLRTTLPALVFCGLELHRRLARPHSQLKAKPAAAAAAAAAGAAADGEGGGGAGAEEEACGKDGDAGTTVDEGEKEAAAAAAAEEEAAAPAVATTTPTITCEALLQFLLAAIEPLYGGPAGQPVIAMRLLLVCGYVASEEAHLELLSYTFFEEAITLYDEALADQRTRAAALYDIIGYLQRCRAFGPEHRDSLTSAVTAGCMRLLSRREQCRALCAAAFLWWQPLPAAVKVGAAAGEGAAKDDGATGTRAEGAQGDVDVRKAEAGPALVEAVAAGVYPPVRDGSKVLSVLQRAAKVAAQSKAQYCSTGRVRDATYLCAYLEVLDCLMRCWDCEVAGVDTDKVQELIDRVQSDLAAGVQPDAETARRWQSTLSYIAASAQQPQGKERYGKLKSSEAAIFLLLKGGLRRYILKTKRERTLARPAVQHPEAPPRRNQLVQRPTSSSRTKLQGHRKAAAALHSRDQRRYSNLPAASTIPKSSPPPAPSPSAIVLVALVTVSAGPSTPRKLSSHALNTLDDSGGIGAVAAGGGSPPTGEAAAVIGFGGEGGDTSVEKRAAPWGSAQYDDVTGAVGSGEIDRRHQAHYGLLSAQIAQAKQREQYRQHHPPHLQEHYSPLEAAAAAPPLPAGETPAATAATSAPGETAAGGGWEAFIGLDPGLFAGPDQDGPYCSVLMPPGVSGGSLAAPAPPVVVSEIPAAPITMERPAPRNLPDYIDQPGDPRVTSTPDKFHPNGHPLTPPEGSLTSLQQHFAFFDINKDGIITLGECITGFRYLLRRLLPEPLNTLAAVPVAMAVQLPLSWLTADSWLPDPRLRVYVRNAHKVVHGSNSKAWDRSGHFTPARFEAVLSKYDRDGKGGLTLWEVFSFLRGQANLGDVLGIMASSGEWIMTWALLRDSTGVLRREDIRGMYDGTAFYRLAERNGYKHYGMHGGRAPAVKIGYA
ncbi:subunit of Retromer complex [Volvox carteri f. nagariensis]|uniref:Subunit of Retromer complex n=1 Tax=Volvox carteri f. nagariensis TaxID=3068 RepID=D8U9T4_VOLCA|nr:subunit of Retromer complex [Volvox carteri f. nagariensis]EFJ43527.1 subunit of Retromer complex [Volvox carteri f. nagariensis]|eukprot:XP_002955456.1 subunit of Retromer complex [Volvox carteri f. nagariensis]